MHKSWRKGAYSPELVFHKFLEDPEFCVIKVIDGYLTRCTSWRTETEFQLLISFIKPHRDVACSMVSDWLKNVLSLAGIDKRKFKGYSTQSASTSKAAFNGLAVSDIVAKCQWSRKSTKQKFFNIS